MSEQSGGLHKKRIDRSIYVTDGYLIGDREVDQAGYDLEISNGDLHFAQSLSHTVNIGETVVPMGKLNVRADSSSQYYLLFTKAGGTIGGYFSENYFELYSDGQISGKLWTTSLNVQNSNIGDFAINGSNSPIGTEAQGLVGTMCWDTSGYLYIKINDTPHTWRRVRLSAY